MFYSKNKAPGSTVSTTTGRSTTGCTSNCRTLPPGPERTKLYEQMRDMIIEDVPYIGSIARTRFYLINPWLKNFQALRDFRTGTSTSTWTKPRGTDEGVSGPTRRAAAPRPCTLRPWQMLVHLARGRAPGGEGRSRSSARSLPGRSWRSTSPGRDEVRVFERRPDPRKGLRRRALINLAALGPRPARALAGVGLDKVVMAGRGRDAGRMLQSPAAGRRRSFPSRRTRRTPMTRSTRCRGAEAEPDAPERRGGGTTSNCASNSARGHRSRLRNGGFSGRAIAAARGLNLAVSGPTTSVRSDLILGATARSRRCASGSSRSTGSSTRRLPGAQVQRNCIPPAAGPAASAEARPTGWSADGFRLSRTLHIWPRHEHDDRSRNRDGSFTCTLFRPFE